MNSCGIDEDDSGWVRLPTSAGRTLVNLIVPEWTVDAACTSVDPELWFPDTGGSSTPPLVLEICAGCPVRESCLATAIVHVEEGIWGGVQSAARKTARAAIARGADPREVLTTLLNAADEVAGRRGRAA